MLGTRHRRSESEGGDVGGGEPERAVLAVEATRRPGGGPRRSGRRVFRRTRVGRDDDGRVVRLLRVKTRRGALDSVRGRPSRDETGPWRAEDLDDGGAGNFVSLGEAIMGPLHARRRPTGWRWRRTPADARLPARLCGMLLDIGSTTTDIVGLVDGVPVPVGRTDECDRLESSGDCTRLLRRSTNAALRDLFGLREGRRVLRDDRGRLPGRSAICCRRSRIAPTPPTADRRLENTRCAAGANGMRRRR